MPVDLIHKIPIQIEETLGREGKDQFVAFLNEVFAELKNSIREDSFVQFETTLKPELIQVHSKMETLKMSLNGEIEKLRYDINLKNVNLQGEVKMEIAEIKIDMVNLRNELKTDIAELRAEMKSDLHELQKSIVDIHKTVAAQTSWILTGMFGVATLSAAMGKIIN
ncbi:LA_3696 family protein [Leptospira kmetyi]|uniref:DUF1640 domain-containing protein n=1 Tax=Leptospira kmetyi TaxID=408139 RepID=A0AAD0UNB7_9LEPT|nr:hypothetical protein [Leptospira kmetyi]AYV56056.1 hypothetical protein EFP84_11420 [Leptospira kmetyi]EQA54457.1 hypothetical protein LEP1GSC052_3676 [Leptospira kmetyi serovar Malaysia str. Bejo-Iso9]